MTLTEAYQILRLDPTNDEKVIKTAFRKLAKAYHPDILKNKPGVTEEDYKYMDTINEAYQVITTSLEDPQTTSAVAIFDGIDDILEDSPEEEEVMSEMDSWFTSMSQGIGADSKPIINSVLKITSLEAKEGVEKPFHIELEDGKSKEMNVVVKPNTLDGETQVVEEDEYKHVLIFKIM